MRPGWCGRETALSLWRHREREADRMRPNTKDQHIPCQSCKMMDYYIIHNEATGQSAVVCQNCKAEFIRIQWAPEVQPDPVVVI